jgi:hypothetical protein
MRAAKWLSLMVAIAFLASGPADARKRTRKSSPRPTASKQTIKEVALLMGKYKWGMSSRAVVNLLANEIRHDYAERLKKEKEPLRQDKLRRDMAEEIAKLRKDHVKFVGKASLWDVSLVDEEFAHKNDESMVVRWGRRDRRFYFFHGDKLWKIYIAFNSDLYRDKTFEDFAAVVQHRFGPAERKFRMTLKGESTLSHLQWPPAGSTSLVAIDNTEFYGNFCLLLIDRKANQLIQARRKRAQSSKQYRDPLIDAVTKPGGGKSTSDNVVEQITGRRITTPKYDDTAGRDQPPKGSSSGN